MREISIAEMDIDAVAAEITRFASDLPSPEDLVNPHPPAVRVIDCVLSLNRPYDTFVVPRLNAFMGRHSEVQQVSELGNLMASYPTPHAFMQRELDYNHEDRARILHEVVTFLCTIVQQTPTIPEEKALKQWAVQAQSQVHRLNIRGFGPAGFQYLCMLFGVDTTKPDIYIIRFVSELLNRDVSDLEAHALLEAACERMGLSIRAVDKYIWNRGARGKQSVDETDHHVVEPAIDIHTERETEGEESEFWAPIRRGEFGELFAGKPVGDKGWISKRIRGRGVEIILSFRKDHSYVSFSCRGENRIERRDEITALFPEADYGYYYHESPQRAMVRFPVVNKGKDHPEDWDEIREKLVSMGTDIYNKINESDL